MRLVLMAITTIAFFLFYFLRLFLFIAWDRFMQNVRNYVLRDSLTNPICLPVYQRKNTLIFLIKLSLLPYFQNRLIVLFPCFVCFSRQNRVSKAVILYINHHCRSLIRIQNKLSKKKKDTYTNTFEDKQFRTKCSINGQI